MARFARFRDRMRSGITDMTVLRPSEGRMRALHRFLQERSPTAANVRFRLFRVKTMPLDFGEMTAKAPRATVRWKRGRPRCKDRTPSRRYLSQSLPLRE